MFKKPIIGLLVCGFSLNAFSTQMATYENSKTSSAPVSGNENQAKELFVISSIHVNRIVTPFKNPSLKLDSVSGTTFKQIDNVLYLSTTSTSNIGGFITEQGNESSAIRVVLNPQPVGPKEIVLEGTNLSGGSEIARQFERSSERTDTLVNISTFMALGKLPEGYQSKAVNAYYFPSCQHNGLNFDFVNGQFFSGGDYVVSVGVVTNTTSQIIEFKENNCYREGVAAVSSYPTTTLLPNEKSEVYVTFYRVKPTVTGRVQRASLLSEVK
jgi:conjugal transfer pilus assembly protein TraK